MYKRDIENKTKLTIENQFVKVFHDLRLEQSMYNHHYFRVRLDHDQFEKRGSYTIEDSLKLLGAPLNIHFGDTDFVGTITNIELAHEHGHEGDLILEGYSQSIKLEDPATLCSWNDYSLGAIFEKVIQPSGIPTHIQPKTKRSIPYMCQYEESSFGFLRRLAAQYYEWFFWDGVKLVLGRPAYTQPIKLEYGPHLDNVRLSIEARPIRYGMYSYRDVDNELTQSQSVDRVAGVNILGDQAVGRSQELYRQRGITHSPRSATDRAWMDPLLEGKQGAATSDIHVLRANSSVQGLKLNSLIKVASLRTGNKYMEEEPEHYGEYRIIEITHHAATNGVYSCSFVAIPSGMEYLPEPDCKMPEAKPQLARVIDNEDPLNQGRIKARFPWQDGSQDTDWIQVMTPDAGSSKQHQQNRGQLFVPEVDDQVMVGFRYGDPMRPFAMGSMYHGENSKGGGPQNHLKTIATRSGHLVQFDDSSANLGITITDKSKNIIHIDTRNSSIRISAPENISLAAKNIDITASENLTASAGDSIGISAQDDLTINAGDSTSISSGNDLHLMSKNITEMASEGFQTISTDLSEQADIITKNSLMGDINLNSPGKIKSNSGKKTNLF